MRIMKSNILVFLTFILFSFCFSACDTENVDPVERVSNYWTSNDLTKLKLRGPVKTLTQGEDVYNFDKLGNKTFENINERKTTYTYKNGYLMTASYSDTINNSSLSGFSKYEYKNKGKFIPIAPNKLNDYGLIFELSAIIGLMGRTDYEFHGNDLWIVHSYLSNNVLVTVDTTIVEYAGDFPIAMTKNNYWELPIINYSNNGMFLDFTNTTRTLSVAPYPSTLTDITYTYFPNDTYLLPSKNVTSSRTIEDYYTRTSIKTINYTYNTFFDIESAETDLETFNLSFDDSIMNLHKSTLIVEYYDYVYDEKENWISRKSHTSIGEYWYGEQIETRTIEYY